VKEAFPLLASLTDTLTTLITNLYISTGLLGIVFAMALESCLIPLPSEIVMPLAGIMIAGHKILQGVSLPVSLVLVGLSGAIGCLIGSIVAYGIGYSGGRPIILKYGRYVLISHHDADKADAFFQRWGSATAFFSRLLPVVRTYISLPAGISKMPFVRFCIYSFLGSFPWCIALAYGGVILGNNMSKLSPIFHSLDIVILVVIVALVALYIWRHINNDRKARAAAARAAQAPAQDWSAQSQARQGQNWNGQSQQPQQPQNSSQSQFPQGQGWNQQAQQPQPQWGNQQGQQPQYPQAEFPQSQFPPQQPWGNQQPQQAQPPAQYPQQQGWPPQADDDRVRRR
jgi:membrane protein DedA with SNARE-associated domain